MKYAIKNYIGKNKNTRKTKAKTTAPTIRRICRVDETGQERFGNSERPTKISSDKSITNGFLKCTFLPKLKENDVQKLASDEQNLIQIQRENAKVESDFYQSLSQMGEHYGLNPMATRHFGYPYNIALALDDIQKQLKNKVRDWEEILVIEEKGKTYFTSEERYNTGATLYYIPIVPLYRLSKNSKRKQAVQLLQSVCSYLYHIAKIPYYRKQDSYLFWMYEMVVEWITSDDENEEKQIHLSEIKQAEHIGDFMEKKIYNQYNLDQFNDHLKNFKAKDGFDNDCFMLTRKIFSLNKQFPNASIYQNLQSCMETEEYESDTIVSMDKYVSFCAEANGLLFQTLFETVNSELQEYTTMQEPMVIKKFDGDNISNNNLDFENRLFPLIEELIYILNNF
ncbi:hypothetical protein GCM10010992_27630 [Cloacibacterium rupense]|uniref:TerB-C domain-containing protein n=1 Tax=Cloacibacterium rupense TaxID=517423 RepID=A0ABQ2NNG4_9FLAO|nr:hypothetical protein [Cloacibacterium rupense]GGP06702.1 hypothetical protein GCM10010992_27630 [Cloacibacterium rupense]